MRALIQRVARASVTIDQGETRQIGPGLVVLLGVTHGDSEGDALYLVEKIVGLRIFRDELDKMNLSIRDIRGECLLISQFTLYGDVSKGRRPSFVLAAPPSSAIPLYEFVIAKLKLYDEIVVRTGEFGAEMLVEIANDGPVTFMIESK